MFRLLQKGTFIAFHGSTYSDPYPQSGYFIGFCTYKKGIPTGPYEVFTAGFTEVNNIVSTSNASYRPMKLAME